MDPIIDLTGFDVVVVGAGTAGLPTAVSCCEHGLRTLVLEKSDRLGGTLWYTGGSISAAGSRLQKAKGIEDSPERHFAEANAIGHGLADQALLRRAVEEAGPTVDWLEELGVNFGDSPAFGPEHELYSTPRTHYQVERREEGTGVPLLAAMRNALKRHTAEGRCVILREARVVDLVAEGGEITGVRFVDRAAAEHTVRAAATVLATGGFGSNPDLMRRLGAEHPAVVSMAAPTSTGDGLEIAERHGAALSHLDRFNPGFGAVEDPLRPGRGLLWMNLSVNRPATLVGDIWVDSTGRRWVREDHPSNDHKEKALAALPDLTFYVIFDQAMYERTPPAGRAWLAEIAVRDVRNMNLKHAATVRDLGAAMGLADPRVLEATVGRYNQAVVAGRDADFGRADLQARIEVAPFHALRMKAFILSTRGGVVMNDRLEVLRRDGTVIRGLYALGEVTGFGRLSGDAQVGGMGVGPCFALGRYAGRLLAERLGRP